MALSVADIERWSAESVREVFHAATARAQVTHSVSRELGAVALFETWGGRAAEAAEQANTQLRQDLDAHGREALIVAGAADRAADGIERVQAALRQVRTDAGHLWVEVDPVKNRLAAAPGSPPVSADTITDLQRRLDAVVAEANAVNDELAQAIDSADGDAPLQSDAGPSVGCGGLTPTQVIGDANGVALREERTRTQTDVDRRQRRLDDLVCHQYMGDHSSEAAAELTASAGRLAAAKNRLAELDAVQRGLWNAPETYLTQLDIPTEYDKPVHATIAVGNPDTAANVSVTVPGVGSTAKDSLPRMVTEANALRLEEIRQLANAGKPTSAAAIVWMGYDPPPNPVTTTSPRDLWHTMTDHRARAGASDLAPYLQQVRANNPAGHLTVLGHSYGSLTASLALQELNTHGTQPVNDAVFYGSPGLELHSPAKLGLDHGHSYVMQAPQDPVTGLLALLAPLHGWGGNPYLPESGMTELSSEPGFDSGGIWRDGAHSHSEYSSSFVNADGRPQLRMSGYNLAAVAAGLPENTMKASLLPPMLGGGMRGVPVPHGGD